MTARFHVDSAPVEHLEPADGELELLHNPAPVDLSALFAPHAPAPALTAPAAHHAGDDSGVTADVGSVAGGRGWRRGGGQSTCEGGGTCTPSTWKDAQMLFIDWMAAATLVCRHV